MSAPAPPGADRAAALAAPAARALLRRSLATGPLQIEARGASMRPWLRAGDRIRLEQRAPRAGDVVLALVGGRLLLHRLRRRSGERWLLRRDARALSDGWVATSEILAIAVARARGRGAWQRLDTRWRRWLALAGAPLLVLARRLLQPAIRPWPARPGGARARRPRERAAPRVECRAPPPP